jgi:hypothetical protein
MHKHIGDQDLDKWGGRWGYRSTFLSRLERFGGHKACSGDIGVNMACYWNGLVKEELVVHVQNGCLNAPTTAAHCVIWRGHAGEQSHRIHPTTVSRIQSHLESMCMAEKSSRLHDG